MPLSHVELPVRDARRDYSSLGRHLHYKNEAQLTIQLARGEKGYISLTKGRTTFSKQKQNCCSLNQTQQYCLANQKQKTGSLPNGTLSLHLKQRRGYCGTLSRCLSSSRFWKPLSAATSASALRLTYSKKDCSRTAWCLLWLQATLHPFYQDVLSQFPWKRVWSTPEPDCRRTPRHTGAYPYLVYGVLSSVTGNTQRCFQFLRKAR